MWALVQNNSIVTTYDTAVPITANGVSHPANIFDIWSEAELNAIGIYTVEENVVGTYNSLFTNEGVVTIAYDSGQNKVIKTTTYSDLPVATIRVNVAAEIDRIREEKLKLGALTGSPTANSYFTVQTRTEQDMININATATLAVSALLSGQSNTVITFRDADNVNHPLSPQEAIEMTQGAFSRLYRHYDYAWQLKDSLGSMTKAQIKALDLEANWPAYP